MAGFKQEAASKGVAPSTLQSAFQSVSPNPRVIELDNKQPERKKIGFESYLRKVMSQKRIDDGRRNFSDNKLLLSRAEMSYGVPSSVITALWGIETSYGANTGGFDLIQALSTLAWDGRRRNFFENELINALMILQGGHISRSDFKGSWAGAMGQNQFMPSSWKRYAVDANNDGHKDIWTTKADIFASSANYLKQNGWNNAYPWGWQVILPNGFSGGSDARKPVLAWVQDGIHFADGHIPSEQMSTRTKLVVPDGGQGRAYLVTDNFDVILSWNRSTYFALTVGLLSDLIGKPPSGASLHLNP